MAYRPAWKVDTGRVIMDTFEFKWFSGLELKQQQKNVASLHNVITPRGKPLEISTKSEHPLGYQLSAFNLKLDGIPLECVYQASKVYAGGGPFVDILSMTPTEAKKDSRRFKSGPLQHFVYKGQVWPLSLGDCFYDYIYYLAVHQSYSKEDLAELLEFDYFTDIEFNPAKSKNCQARAVAIVKALILLDKF